MGRAMLSYVGARAWRCSAPGTIVGIGNDLARSGEFLTERHPELA
jgi:hypothetical protein